jgi:endogenous inhibitor of DNA gyrase (YacG/DUF329 family)
MTDRVLRPLLNCPPCPRCGTTTRLMNTEREDGAPEQYTTVYCPKCQFKFYSEMEEVA